jgi:cytochrome c-type biogenesis protein
MHGSILLGGSVVVATIGGVIALLAPCCVSVMLPSYFAGAFHNRRTLVAMTFVFGAGVATIILPLALGAAVLRRAIFGHHTGIYLGGAALLVGLGLYTLAGGRLRIPQPGGRAVARGGPFGVYSLGAFSGVATACCAPVLAGVIALSGSASSFVTSLVLGLAYVFGMVAPLFAAALAWDRYGERFAAVTRPRTITYRIGRITRTISGSALASGVVLILMGAITAWIGMHPDSMGTKGWQASFTAHLQHYGHDVTEALRWLPGWLAIVALVLVVIALARRAFREVQPSRDSDADPTSEPAQQGAETE